MEKPTLRAYHLFVAALFVCILLSFTVFYVTQNLFSKSSDIADTCYDGTVIEGTDPINGFLRSVYQNKNSIARVREYEYRLFGIVNNGNVISGKEDFLFEMKNEETGYDYLRDYLGKSAFTEEESAAILAELNRRRTEYGEMGAEYLLVIIPNSQTVYGEYMPPYIGNISKNTRLSRLADYLGQNGFVSFVDLTEPLKNAKSAGLLYNNTENSLNALGVYYAYRAVYDRFSDTVRATTTPVTKEDLSFYEHRTAGKAIAKAAGLEETVLNNTVSLSNNTAIYYTYLMNTGGITKTVLKPAVAQGQSTSLLLQFSRNWEKLQSEPFFSNTFYRVTYQQGLEEDEAIFAEAQPSVVIQFLYEYELGSLLPAGQ